MKKIVTMILAITLVSSYTTMGFANTIPNVNQIAANAEAEVLAKYTGNEKINKNITEGKTKYTINGNDGIFELPRKGNSEIVIDDNENTLKMKLPKVVHDSKGILAENGSIVYNATDNTLSVTTQVIDVTQGNSKFDAVRTLLTIKSSAAPKEYSFDFDLPEGFTMVKDFDYDDAYDDYDCGSIFILDQNGDIINTIEPAWAKDANDNSVSTTYTIKDSTLIQYVDFNEDSSFPIVADPTTHPTEYSYYYLDKAGVKAMRDKYASATSATNFYSGLLALCATYKAPMLGVGTSIYFVNILYAMVKYATWNKFYVNFEKKYARISVSFRWRNGGKNSGYILDKTTCSYVQSSK